MDGYYSVGVQSSLRFPIERPIFVDKGILRSVGQGAVLGLLSTGLAAICLVVLSVTRPNFLLSLNGWATQPVASANNIVEPSLASQQSITPAITPVNPIKPAPSQQPLTNQALNQLITNFVSSHAGSFTVSTRQLTGSGDINAAYQGAQQMRSASTYKVFLAYAALRKVEQGKLSMSTRVDGHTLDYCIQQMIVVSDNDCADAVGDKVSWLYADTQAHRDGFTHTLLNSTDNVTYSTADDEALVMAKLSSGQLVNHEHTSYLLGLMKRQIFRNGIPAGSKGSVVADKVGFIDALNDDMAVVYGPKANYSLVIMTDNAETHAVRDLAQQIYDFYDQHAGQ